MCHDQVCKLGQELLRCRLADKEPNVIESIGGPRHKDQDTNENGTNGIDVPDNTTSNNGHGKTKRVDDNVVTVIDEEDVY
jgi:hypothetical protein